MYIIYSLLLKMYLVFLRTHDFGVFFSGGGRQLVYMVIFSYLFVFDGALYIYLFILTVFAINIYPSIKHNINNSFTMLYCRLILFCCSLFKSLWCSVL